MDPAKPTVGLIAAVARGRVIGRDGAMPWHLPADLKRFKRVTMGHPVLMGRKTFEAIGRPLPGRRNIVVTRRTAFEAAGIETAASLEEALARVAADSLAFVIGGGEIYAAALPYADFIDLCEIDLAVEGDAFFPAFDPEIFVEQSREDFPAEGDTPAFSFVRYDRR